MRGKGRTTSVVILGGIINMATPKTTAQALKRPSDKTTSATPLNANQI